MFFTMLLIQLLTAAHVAIHIGNKGYIHGNLKDCNFKTSKNPWKIWKYKSWKKGPRYYKISFYSKYIHTFNELVIENTQVKKIRALFAFMEWLHLLHG